MNLRSKLASALCWTGVVLGAGFVVAYGYITELDRRQHAVRPDDGCLAYAPPPAVTVLLDDETDPLTGDQPRRWRATVDEEVARLPPGSVLLIGAVGARAPAEMKFVKLCVPLAGRGPRAGQLQKAFNAKLDEVAALLVESPSSPQSDISGTILAAASDAAFLGTKTQGPRRLVINSDLLENASASAYARGGLSLPVPDGQPLKGVAVRFAALRNLRDDRFQTRHLIKTWVNWAKNDAGATSVEVDAGWLGYVAPPTPAESESDTRR
jgi:hypothetical protein